MLPSLFWPSVPLLRIVTVFLCCSALLPPAQADDIRVATASNFLSTLQRLATDFERAQPHRIHISSGSTGKLYAQIIHGAPYDLFLSADAERPALLHERGLAEAPRTYAIGRLVLYASAGDPLTRLRALDFRRLAIANPRTAPYGTAARNVLEDMQLWDKARGQLALGENIGQTFQFVHSGNAELGFVALAQVRALKAPPDRYWEVPADRHVPLIQQAVLLRRSTAPVAAQLFLDYLTGEAARRIIETDGYGVP